MIREIQRVRDNLWIVIPENTPGVDQPNIGVLVAGGRVVLIDCGNSPAYLRAVLTEINALLRAPIGTIIYTHHHWDHVFGACALPAPVIAHEACYRRLVPWAGSEIDRTFWEEEIRRYPPFAQSHRAKLALIPNWENFRVVPPTITYEKRLRLRLGSRTLELLHVDAPHSDDSTLVHIREAGVLFLGDALYPPPVYAPERRARSYRKLLAVLASEEAELFIPGHGEPMDKKALRNWMKRRACS
jgi:glyoxylase-like metal-dependent hydrolase (beta-lactamase superfamily II)